MHYPDTRRDATVDTLHGREVPDPYRWLEDPDSPDTVDWVARQRRFTESVLDELPARGHFHDLAQRLVSRPRAGVVRRQSGWWLVTRNDGSQPQDILYGARSLADLEAGGQVLLDPNTWSEDGTASLSTFAINPAGTVLAYAPSDAGSDWRRLRFLRLSDGTHLDEADVVTKFCEPLWVCDDTFLYEQWDGSDDVDGTTASALTGHRLVAHRLGTPTSEDRVVLELPDEPRVMFHATVADDRRWLHVGLHRGTERTNRLWSFRLHHGPDGITWSPARRLVDAETATWEVVGSDGDQLWLLTDDDAPLSRVVRIDLADDHAEAVEVVPEGHDALGSAHLDARSLLTVALTDAQPRIARWSRDGAPLGELPLSGGGVTWLEADSTSEEVFVGLSTLTEPTVCHVVDATTTRRLDLAPPGATLPRVVQERRSAVSADGTTVPYFLAHRADVPLDRPRPTLLWGYGGFRIPVLAEYRPVFAAWLAAGGVLALANLRGGSEYGVEWWRAGSRAAKQHVFDDCIAVAEHLAETGVTTPTQLTLHGRSNGGLLVGAVLTQRPDVIGCALPAVGVLDMLRFHKFTIGAAWISDYGDPDVVEDFEVALAYSPLHRVVEGRHYPPTLVATGDHDDRVVPAHSHKFTATLQHAQGGPSPILTRIEESTGHGLGKPAAMVAAEAADLLSFAAHHTGLEPLPWLEATTTAESAAQ